MTRRRAIRRRIRRGSPERAIAALLAAILTLPVLAVRAGLAMMGRG